MNDSEKFKGCFRVDNINLFVELLRWISKMSLVYAAWKVSKYEVFSGASFPVFGVNTGKCGPEKTPYLDTLSIGLLYNICSFKDFVQYKQHLEKC